ncbi:MAG: hypothetical protein AABZ53_03945 [Planctomycetota bacterium]
MIKTATTAPSRINGFALLGKQTRQTGTQLEVIAKALSEGADYEVVQVLDEFWIRDSDLTGSSSKYLLKRCAAMSASTLDDIAVSAAIARYEHSVYGKKFYEGNAPASMDAIRDALNDPKLTASPSGWNRLSQAVFHAPKGQLTSVLLDLVLPLGFKWYPKGCARLFLHEPPLNLRFSLVRNTRVCAAFNVLDFAPNTPNADPEIPQSLTAWQLDWPPALFDTLIEWASLLVFPKVTGMLWGMPGLSIQFIDDAIGDYKSPVMPISLLDLKHGKTQFGQERAEMTIGPQSISVARTAVHGRYCWHGDGDQAVVLADFIAERANRLNRCLGDITNYEREIDGLLQIDLVIAQEQMWTLGRIIRRTLSLQSSESRWINRLAVFEVADQWGELMGEWKGGHPTAKFKTLMHPANGAALVKECFATLPDPWRARFEVACADVYQDILQTMKQSVWSRQKASAAGVNLGTRAAPQVEAWADFTANVLRDLRNTHHGYMPDEKYNKNTRPRFVLTTGEWSPAMTFLPSLWLLAFLCDPVKFVGWPTRASAW